MNICILAATPTTSPSATSKTMAIFALVPGMLAQREML